MNLPTLTRNQLIRLLAFLGLCGLAVGVRFYWVPWRKAELVVRYFGYWATLAIAGLFVLMAKKALSGWRFSRAVHGGPLIVAVLCSLFLQIHEPRELKVLYDEYVHLATSLEMHEHRQACSPAQVQYENGRLIEASFEVERRPLFFAFLLSAIHDISGYRVSNVFILNGLISLALFWFVFWLGESIGGRGIGYAAMLLLAGLPLVASVATSGSYDLLNLALLVALVLSARRYCETPTAENQSLLVMAGVLIAQARFESILFLLPVGAVLTLVWWKERKVEITLTTVSVPLLVLPPLLSNLVYLSEGSYLESQGEGVAFFDLANVVPNLGRAVYYLFDLSGTMTNSPLVSYAGMAALLLLVVGFRSLSRRTFERKGVLTVYYIFLAIVLINTAVILANFWGHFDDPMATRFSLPLQLFLLISILFIAARPGRQCRAAPVLVALSLLSIWVWSIPVDAQAHATRGFFGANEKNWWQSQMKNYDSRTLVLAESSLPFVVNHQPVVSFGLFNQNPARVLELKEEGFYDQILVFQTLRIDSKTGAETDISINAPVTLPKLERISETRFQSGIISRLSRVVGAEEGSAVQTN